MTTNHRPLLLATGALLVALTQPAVAERADRSKPVNIEANKVTVNEKQMRHVFEGNVVLTQGTLQIKGDQLVVTQDGDGFQKGVATGQGRLATFRQKRDGSGDFVDGEAQRIEYDGKTQKTYLFENAYVVSGKDEVRGQYIEYDGFTGQYIVTNSGSTRASSGGGRVRAVIQPKNAGTETTPDPAAPASGAPAAEGAATQQ